MNRESFYLEIGNIDDDLIQEASAAHGQAKRRTPFARFAGIAACLCLICAALLYGLQRDAVYYNEANAPIASKLLVPADENTTIRTLTYQELLDYYGLTQFPDRLSDLEALEQSQYYVYQDSKNVVYDTNVLQYRSDDGAKTLSVVIAKEDPCYKAQGTGLKQSRLDGISLVLAVSNEDVGSIYWAELTCQGVNMRIVSYGVDEASFIAIVREIIQSQK